MTTFQLNQAHSKQRQHTDVWTVLNRLRADIEPVAKPKIEVRLGTPADAERLAILGARMFAASHHAAFRPEDLGQYVIQSFNPQIWSAHLSDPKTTVLIAECENQICGFTKISSQSAPAAVKGPQQVELAPLYLDTPWIGRGIDSILMTQALKQATAAGYRTGWLSAWAKNRQALEFYLRWGFTAVAQDKMQVGQSIVPLVVMSRSLAGIESQRRHRNEAGVLNLSGLRPTRERY